MEMSSQVNIDYSFMGIWKMQGKRCFKCGNNQPLENFYKHKQMKDGHLNKCIDCTKREAVKNRTDNIEYYRAYDRQRGHLPQRIALGKIFNETNPGVVQKAKDDYVKRNPEKKAAHTAVSNAVRDGRLIRKPCEKCGREDSQAHHDDYTKQLNVRWLCSFHHAEHHKNERGKKPFISKRKSQITAPF